MKTIKLLIPYHNLKQCKHLKTLLHCTILLLYQHSNIINFPTTSTNYPKLHTFLYVHSYLYTHTCTHTHTHTLWMESKRKIEYGAAQGWRMKTIWSVCPAAFTSSSVSHGSTLKTTVCCSLLTAATWEIRPPSCSNWETVDQNLWHARNPTAHPRSRSLIIQALKSGIVTP